MQTQTATFIHTKTQAVRQDRGHLDQINWHAVGALAILAAVWFAVFATLAK